MEVWEKVVLEGLKNKGEFRAFFDTGSTYGHLDRKIAEDLGFVVTPLVIESTVADGGTVKANLAAGFLTVKGCRKPIFIAVREKGVIPLSIGFTQMELVGVKLDPRNGEVTVNCSTIRG